MSDAFTYADTFSRHHTSRRLRTNADTQKSAIGLAEMCGVLFLDDCAAVPHGQERKITPVLIFSFLFHHADSLGL